MYDCGMEKLIYQMFILGTGEFLDEALKKGLGGVIFFTRDIESKEQFKALIKDIKTKALIPPFLSIDQEGGRVERTGNIHPRYLSARYAFQKGENVLKHQTEQIAQELKEYGINLNFAPVADVNTNPDNPIIGERAFSDNAEEVSKCVKLVSGIYRKYGIIPCLKHYPGHGDTDKDSHLTLPCVDLPLNEMKKIHIKPFRENIEAEMIMAGHIYCKCFDSQEMPASLSKNAIGYLRNNLGYEGVVITDDMNMNGVGSYDASQACVSALLAGVDMFIFRNSDSETIETIEKFVLKTENNETLKRRILEANERIQRLKEQSLKI